MTSSEDPVIINFSCLNIPSDCAQSGSRIALTIQSESGNYVEIGQTETKVGVSPSFQTSLQVMFKPSCSQQLRLILYKVDAETEVIQGKVGESEVTLLTLLSNANEVALPVYRDTADHANPQPPVIVANANPAGVASNGTVLQFSGASFNHISKENLLVAPYFVLQLTPINEDSQPIILYRSEVAKDSNNPRWKEFTLPTRFFPAASEYSLQVIVLNFCNNRDKDAVLGCISTTFYQLLNGSSNKFLLKEGHKRKDNSTLELVNIHPIFDLSASFSHSIKLGTQLHFTLAVDFTSNNGSPNEPSSLHFIHPHSMNLYMTTIATIFPELAKFDRLNRISLLGFGAKIPPRFEFSNLFALNSDLNNPYVRNVEDALHFYRNSSISCLPYAPTDYAEVIHYITQLAKASQRTGSSLYFVLLILTNGSVKNIQGAIDSIVKASYLPCSIVFVALGNYKHPVASATSGDTVNLKKFVSSDLKSFNNVPLCRETVSLVLPQNNENVDSSTVFDCISRQVVLHSLINQVKTE